MTANERDLDLIIGDLEQENRLLRARNDRLAKIVEAAGDMCNALRTPDSSYELWSRNLDRLEKLLAAHDS